jgi:hypothetical protein
MISKAKLCAVYAILAALTITEVHANGSPPTAPSPGPATASADASAGASAGASSSQRQGQQQAQGQGQSAEVNSANNFGGDSSRLYVFPAPVFVPPMAAVQCPAGVRVSNEAAAIGWNFASIAKGSTDNSDCVLIMLRNAYVEQCQYQSAKQVQDLLTAKHLPGFKASGTVYLDLTRAECDALKTPVIERKQELVYVPVPALPRASEAASAPAPAKPRHKTVFKAPKCSVPASVPACRP